MRIRVLLLGLCLVCLLLPATVSAHANLIESLPAANAVLPVAPPTAELRFSEPLEPGGGATLADVQGNTVATGATRIAPDNPNKLLLDLPQLPVGSYVIRWNVVSSADGHPSKGTIPFVIGDPQAATTPLSLPPVVTNPIAAPPALSVAARWLTVLALTMMGGALFFAQGIGQQLVPGDDSLAYQHYRRWHWRSFVAAVVLSLLATLLSFYQAAQATGWSFTAFSGSRSTVVLGFRWLLLVATLVAAAWSGFEPRRLRVPLVLWGAAALSVSLLGHSAVANDLHGHNVSTALTLDLVHLAATAAWIGGLVQLAGVFWAVRPLPQARRLLLLGRVVPQFSTVALWSVIALTVTGLYSAQRHFSAIDQLWTTTYGRSLLLKLVLFAGLVALGALNKQWLTPHIQNSQTALRAAKLLKRAISIELGLGLLVLLVVGSLTSSPPASAVVQPQGYIAYTTVDGVELTLQVQAEATGQYVVAVTTEGLPSNTPTRVLLRPTMQMQHTLDTPQEVELTPVGGGRWGARGSFLNMAGVWQFDVVVQSEGRAPLTHSFAVDTAVVDNPTTALTLWQRLALPRSILVAFALLALSLVVGVAGAWVSRGWPRRRWVRATQALVFGSFLACTVPYYWAVARTPRNPYTATAEVLAQGQQIYTKNCVPCHGVTGQGNGPAARTLPVQPANFTLPHYLSHPEAQLYDWVKNGIGGRGMPAFGQQLSAQEIWQVLTYINDLNRQALPAQQSSAAP